MNLTIVQSITNILVFGPKWTQWKFSLQPDWQINNVFFIKQTNYDIYSNPGTQAGPQDKDFRTVLQTDLMRSLVSISFASYPLIFVKHGFYKSFHLLHLKFL